MPVSGADGYVAAFGDLKEICWSAAPAVDSACDVQGAGVIAARVEGDVTVGRSRCGGLGEGQEGEEQGGDREGDQEGVMPPPPDRVSAAAARRAWWATVRKLAMCVTPQTLHQRNPFVIPALVSGISPSSAPKPLPRRRRMFSVRRAAPTAWVR